MCVRGATEAGAPARAALGAARRREQVRGPHLGPREPRAADARARRRLQRGIKKKGTALLKKLRKKRGDAVTDSDSDEGDW